MNTNDRKSRTLSVDTSKLVWAKMRTYPYWPARIIDDPVEVHGVSKDRVCVLFFGTQEFAYVDNDKIENYQENRAKYVAKYKSSAFANAVEQMDKFISDPITFRNYGIVVPIVNSLPVAKKSNAGKKLVNKNSKPQMKRELGTVQQPQATVSVEEGKQFDIIKLKGESAENKNEFQKIRNELALVTSKMEISVKSLSNEMADLKIQLSKMKTHLTNSEQRNGKIISDLVQENRLLTAGFKQLKKCQTESTKSIVKKETKTPIQSDFHEVQALLEDKMENGKRVYLVRWKGFGSQHDSWVRESDLKCSQILKKYKNSKRQ